MKKTMGEMIAELRKNQGMTQKDLAEKMNVTDKAVSKWERNLSCPDVASIPQLAQILGVSTDALLNVSAEEKSAEAEKILDIVLKAVPLAMGVALAVTALLGELPVNSGFTMAGIGIFCLSLSAFRKA